MNNGQLNIASMLTVTQLATQDPTLPVAAPTDGGEQDGGDFAGVLGGIQHVAKGKEMPDSGQTKQATIKMSKHQLPLDAGAEGSAVDLLTRLRVSPDITAGSEPAVPKQEVPKKDDMSTGAVALGSEPSDVASQIAMAAYLQTGRIPEVAIPTRPPVDRLQNVVTVTEQPVAGQMQAPQVIMPIQLGTAKESASAVEIQSEQVVAEPTQAPQVITPVQLGAAKESTSASLPQPVASDRMSDVNKSTQLPVDSLQNAASPGAANLSALLSASSDKIQVEQTIAEPVQTIPAEKSAVSSIALQHELPSAHQDAPAPVSSPESEVEIQLSQPQPITARVTTEPVVAGNRSAALVQESRGGRQRFTTEQQIEKVRTGDEQSAVKEMAPSLQSAASSGKSLGDSDTPHDQGQPGSASDDQMLAQQMRGQLSTEHQKVAALSAKAVPTEPARQDIPEQIMRQVNERLVQHDVKPGNQQITLTLSPGTLGELKMNLNLQGQKLSVEIVTENRMVRDAIIQHTDTLKESLARQNITMESFDVTTGGKGGSGYQGQNQNAWSELAKQQQQQQSWALPRGYNIAQADLPSSPAAYQRQQGQSMLDIHY
jgi:flagellar hook-length control protein FliK